MSLSRDELIRYSRQIKLEQVGIQGQQRLTEAHVIVLGVGGLGCPASSYLASAGVGRITLIDPDQIELSNLQRQILYSNDNIGQDKVSAAQQRLQQQNPEIEITTLCEAPDEARLIELLADADLLLDCCDNFATRHAVNRACRRTQTALVSAAGVRLEGQLAVFRFDRHRAPCYHCLFPEVAGDTDTCAAAGILAPVVGILGAMQALEALKVLLETGADRHGKLLCFDALSSQWRDLAFNADPSCPVCSN